MPPAACVASAADRTPIVLPPPLQPPPAMVSDSFAKDAIIAWFRGEFAAANAVIDALCNHLTQLEGGGGSNYESVFAAIHRRRLNWIPVLQMQKYYSIADVTSELRRVAERKTRGGDLPVVEELKTSAAESEKNREAPRCDSPEVKQNGVREAVDEESIRYESQESEITDSGSPNSQPTMEAMNLCSNHEGCEARRATIKMTKGFVAKESAKGHMVNVARGLKLYEDVFTDSELSKLSEFVNELRFAGQNGDLSGETFISYNQQAIGKRRELIQLGAPIFGSIEEGSTVEHETNHIEPIPTLLQAAIDHLVQWHIISENRKPNSCIINFFDEGEYSHPFLKPPHLEQPISTLLLSESTMAFGQNLVNDDEGNYKGTLTLPLKKGSLLVMRGNSSEVASHAMCSSTNKRVSITFFTVRPDPNQNNPTALPPLTRAMTMWQPGVPSSNPTAVPPVNGYKAAMGVVPKWGMLQPPPMVMLAPMPQMVPSPKTIPQGANGTGVFLPWSAGPRKPAKHLPPRAQRERLLGLSSQEPSSDSAVKSDQKQDV